MDEALMFMNKALDFYNSLCVSGRWNIPKGHGRFNACWNCGNVNCNAHCCPKPRNEQKIQENRKKYNESRKKSDEGKGSNSHGRKKKSE